MERTIIQWNMTNWITIVVMATLGWLILAVISQSVRKWRGSSNAEAA